MPTLAELTTPMTRSEIEAAIYASVEARGVSTTAWQPGAVARTIITATALVLSAFSTLQASIAKGGFLELATKDWLTLVARHVYGVERSTGTFAAGSVTFNNTAGGVFSLGVGDVVVKTAAGKTYRNTAAFTLAAFETGKVVSVQAVELGSDSTAAPGAINALETVLSGVTVTNAAALVGENPESDPDLRARCLAKTGTLSPNGPADAYRFLALSAKMSDGTVAGVSRVTTVPDGAGNVTVYVATASGPVTGTIGDTSTALGAVDEAVQTLAVPLSVTATTVSATALTIAPSYDLWVRGTIGLTVTELDSQIATKLATFMSSQPIGGSRKVAGGGYVFRDALEGVIAETVGTAHLIDVAVTVPAGDTPVSASQAPVLGTITPNTTLVSI